jgi:tetratricopeptide (TPR) repeat protein
LATPAFIRAALPAATSQANPPQTSSAGSRPAPSLEAIRLNNQGVAYMNQQQPDKAEAAFAAAQTKDPAFAQAILNHGIALFYQQKLGPAKDTLQASIKIAGNDPRAWFNLGLVERAQNDLEAATASFREAARLDPTDADSVYFAGVCLQELKRPDEAIQAFESALRLNPLHASAQFALARALQRSGQPDLAKVHFQSFQHMTSAKISTALGLTYGDQGRYSSAAPYALPTTAAPPMIPVHFTAQPLVPGAAAKYASPESGGSCMIDVDGDGLYDLVILRSGTSAIQVLRNRGDGSFESLPSAGFGLDASGHAISCAAGDYDNDGLADLAVALNVDAGHASQLLLFHNLGKGKFENVTPASGLAGTNHPQSITFADYDHDGDLDLFLTGSSLKPGGPANQLWRNNGNGTFTDVTGESGLGGEGSSPATRSVVFTDLNNDRAVDLVTTGDDAGPMVHLNPREGKYPSRLLFASDIASTTNGIAALDFNKDGWMDIAVTHTGLPAISLWRSNDSSLSFSPVPLPTRGFRRGWGITPIDFDNDGWVDLAAILETDKGESQVHIFRNLGNGSFEDVSHALGLDAIPLSSARGLIAFDANGDGAADLIVTSSGSDPILLLNHGGNRNRSVLLKFTGFADNKTALGTKVELFANGSSQKWELAGNSGYLSQGPPEILAGLGASGAGIDLVRMLWPTGVPQDEIDVPTKPVVTFTEADRRGSSCPVLFAWNGKRFGLITDTIGAAVIGHWFTPTRRNLTRPEEWIKVEGSQLAVDHGRLSLRFAEPMEEVNYIDQLRLRAIDHPEDTEANPDERFLDDPPFATGAPVISHAPRSVQQAWDDHGRDVTRQLSSADHQFVGDFVKLPYDGFANRHVLTLDLGLIHPENPLRLLITGYVEYFSATSLYSAWQAGLSPVSPYVEAQLPDGSWQRILEEMGFPAGLERTIVSDLTGKLPAGARRIRIVTNLQIYWDQILVDNTSPLSHDSKDLRETEIPLTRATLRFHGYPLQIEGKSSGDLQYDYNQVSLTGPFQRQRGAYTRFGDVTPLLTGIDNRFAIFGSGEEIAADFDATALPPLPPHWKRDYFFYANGFVKDMDYYDGSPFTVSQLPFHGMSTYPYPAGESYPEDPAAIDYQLNWNDRFDSGAPAQSFRFHYQSRPESPSDSVVPDARAEQP